MIRRAAPQPNIPEHSSESASTKPKPPKGTPHEGTAASSAEPPKDGDHNQGGARPQGLEYQKDLGTAQDA
jgi:hypothetical protein